ncbi:Uncharacterized protein APZ42_033170 [Daphnia magna]|uniref:CxC3 like cysteine cluster domain-containing protein n=1 Tax=Daphnia magna TaxID=35525 RepID=A0A164LBU0_9CRUS|nr:Uncharacterized protein APZ42_033170 [Daphnia magna]
MRMILNQAYMFWMSSGYLRVRLVEFHRMTEGVFFFFQKFFIYVGKTRHKKDPSFGDALPHCSSSLKQPPFVSPSNSAAHDSLFDDVPSVISPEALDDHRSLVQKDLVSMQIRRNQTWQEWQAIAAWGRHDRRRIFTEYVSRQPLNHSKCDQCHEDLNHCSVRCRFVLKGATFVCDTCDSLTKALIDDYVFSGFFPASLSETVTYLFLEEALLLCHHISHKCPGSSKNMYAHTFEEVSEEYGWSGPINILLFTAAEREWETCRHYIDMEVFKRNKIYCPSCGTKPLARSSDAIIKLRRFASAGKARKPENERVMDDVESRFENLVIKSDVEVETFRQRIYNKVQTTIDLLNSKDKDLPISYEDFNQGIFPWEAVINENDTKFPTLSYADKYHVVDCWMLLQRAKEEVELTRIEMIN